MIVNDGYRAYLHSSQWRSLREQRLERDDWRCTGCGSDGSDSRLEVHHLTYERVGAERLEDLLTLCHLCHAHEHGRAPSVGLLPCAGLSAAELREQADLREEQRATLGAAERASKPLSERLRALEVAYLGGESHLEGDLRVVRQRIQKWLAAV